MEVEEASLAITLSSPDQLCETRAKVARLTVAIHTQDAGVRASIAAAEPPDARRYGRRRPAGTRSPDQA